MHVTPGGATGGGEQAVPVGAGFAGRVASAARWQAIDQVLQQALRFGVTVVLTKLLLPEDFGIVAIALVIAELASLLTTVGLGSALVQRRDLSAEHVAVAFTATSAFGLAFALLVVALAPAAAGFFEEPELTDVLRVLSVSFVFKGLHAVPLDLLRRELLFDRVIIMSTAATIVAGGVAVATALAGAGVWALVAFTVVEAALALVVVWVLALQAGTFRPRVSMDLGALKDLFGFGAYVSGVRLLDFGQGNLDNLIIARVLGSTALGFYSVAYRLMLLPILRIANVVSIVAFPAFASIQDDLVRLLAAFQRAVRSITLVCFPISLGTAVVASLLVELIFGTAWLPSVPVVQILALNGPRLALARLNGATLLARDRPSWELGVVATSFVLYLVGFLVGVQYGIEGVAWGFTVAGYVAAPIGFVATARVLQTTVPTLLRATLPAAVSSVVMAAAALAALAVVGEGAPLVVRLVAAVVAGAAAYLAVLRAVWPDDLTGLVQDLTRRNRNPSVAA